MSMDALARLRREGEALEGGITRERYLAGAGLKPAPELAPLFARHAGAYDDEALAMTLDAWRGASTQAEGAASDEARTARALLEWVVDARAGRGLAELDERIARWERGAGVRGPDGREVPYQQVTIEVANTRDRRERLLLDDARAALVAAELAPMARDRLSRERELIEAAGVADGYVATFEALTTIDLRALAGECRGFLADTQAMWDDVLPEVLRRELGVEPAEAVRADAALLLRMPHFDGAFPRGAMETTIRLQVESMGLDPRAGGRIRYDVGERPGKRPRAFCAPVRVPDEVYLVLRPHGGQADWRTFLHELGHALHFANVDAALPFELRQLGDNSVTEGYAMLLDHLLLDRGWLRRYTELGTGALDDFLRASAFEELLFLRRYCGKLLYELELHGGGVPESSVSDFYVETLRAATGFRYQAADAHVDVDLRFYSARYLRAWQLQAVLADALRERFDEDWWRNPAAGPWLARELFAAGQRETAHELAARVAAGGLSFVPLVRDLERRLA
jgi:hypothetical protein